MLNVLLIGDVVGGSARKILKTQISIIKKQQDIDFCILNGENSAGGLGITYRVANEFFDMGVDCITLGNHTWSKKEITNFIDGKMNIIRPINYSDKLPGRGSVVLSNEAGDKKLGVINAQGQVYMNPIDSPFDACDKAVTALKAETKAIIIDFHAEATSEKNALAWFLDGRVSGVVGTHTHVQTADEKILPRGTAFITDIGMTGPRDSVIGMGIETVVNKFCTQFPSPYQTANGPVQLNAVVISIDESTGRATSIKRLNEVFEDVN